MPKAETNDLTCEIQDWPRNSIGACELSIIYYKDHEFYREPANCWHRKFKLKMKGESD